MHNNDHLVNSKDLEGQILDLSEYNATRISEIILHFQILKSARAHWLMMDAPGLYFADLNIYVISKSGSSSRGHASLYKSIQELLPGGCAVPYGFVLYPETYVRTCLDKLLRRTICQVNKDIRLSMENVFNKKYHRQSLVGSKIEKEIVDLLKNDSVK